MIHSIASSAIHRSATPKHVFRVWITRVDSASLVGRGIAPAMAEAIEPAEDGCFSRDEAMAYVEGFNQTAVADMDGMWAVAVPVRQVYEGDLLPGQRLVAYPGPCREVGTTATTLAGEPG